jgi:hypothetical protein
VIDAFSASPWTGVLLWAALYISDFLFTMLCARLYKAGARQQIHFEGSYEITPYYQKEVDAIRLLSPRFVIALVTSSAVQFALWWLTMRVIVVPQLYFFGLGAMVLVQLTVHVRHLRNYFLFRAILAGDGITGRIEYARPVMLRMSAVEMFAFAAVYAVIYLITDSWFVLGGVFVCLSVGLNHHALASNHVAAAAVASKDAAVRSN